MGLSLLTALEIFTNPGDLEVMIGQGDGEVKFSIGISRGPGHNFKPLFESAPFAEAKEDAIKAMGDILQTIYNKITNESEALGSVLSEVFILDGKTIDESKVLNPNLIGRILEELQLHGKASTYEMLAPAG